MVLQNSTPAKYEAWLTALVERAVAAPFMGEPMVVVNAWNEWAEGAYLEPDQHYGAAYLNATARAVSGAGKATGRPAVLLVGHDAHPHGAQELLWNIGRTLRRRFGAEIEYLLLDGGELVRRYEEIAPTAVLPSTKDLDSVLSAFHARGFRSAIVNTTAAAHVVKPAASIGIAATQLVHELPRIIGDMKLAPQCAKRWRMHAKSCSPAAWCATRWSEPSAAARPRPNSLSARRASTSRRYARSRTGRGSASHWASSLMRGWCSASASPICAKGSTCSCKPGA